MNDRFLAFSSEVTAFPVFELRGTGMTDEYLAAVERVIGSALLTELLDTYDRLPQGPPDERLRRFRQTIFGDPKLGPLARNIIKLWYIGVWYVLPHEWTDAYGALPNNVTFMVSPVAYTEGLLWVALGANPPGAKGPGYGSWGDAPRIQLV
jgi:hypothetical protein